MSSETYARLAQLAEAAYFDLWDAENNDVLHNEVLILARLINGGFSQTQANAFVNSATGFTVLSISPPALNGFSATLFLDNATGEKILSIRGSDDIFDALTDVIDIAYLGTTETQSQYESLNAYYGMLVAEGLLGEQETFSVTGHSLGGFLAQAFSVEHYANVNNTYTFNAPGFADDAPELFGALGIAGNFNIPSMTNVIAEVGPETTADLRQLIGGVENVFIENQSGLSGALENHSIKLLTDSLAVYSLLGILNPSLTTQQITPILESASNEAEKSLESIVNALGDLFGVGANAGTGDRDALHARIQTIQAELVWYPQIALTSLHDDPPEAIATAAKADKGFLYALEHLNPFAVVGDDFLYTGLDPAQYSDSYLMDRARLLEDKLARAIVDDTDSQDFGPYDGTAVHFIDKDSRYDVRILPGSPGLRIEFGSDKPGIAGEDALTGTAGVDHLYGRGGDDRLEGGRGDDRMEGGQGHDTYVYNTKDGFDTIFDSDGLGEILFNDTITLSGGKQTTAGANTWYDEVNDVRYTLDTTQANSLLTITQGADSFQVKGYQPGQLGITLEAYSETPFVDPTNYQAINLAIPGDAGKIDVYRDQEIWGLDVADWLQLGGSGKHIVHAGGGDDVVFEDWTGDVPPPDYAGEFPVGPSDDIFYGEAGRDALEAGDGSDRLFGGTEQDLLSGMGDEDYLEGNAGDDVLAGGAGQDTLKGGTGNDDLWGDATWSTLDPNWTASRTGTFKVDLGFDYSADVGGADISPNDDLDELYGGAGDDLLLGGGGDDLMFGEADRDTLFGQYGNDYLDGGAQADHLRGDVKVGALIDDPENLGYDVLIGGSGNDLLEGGFGDDVLFGGTDNDVLEGDFDIKPEWAGDDHLDGGQGNDELRGGLGNDTLIGGAGADTLDGGPGNDQLEGDAGSDVYVINTNEGSDVIVDRDANPNTDRLAFGAGLSALQARLARSGADLDVGFADSANSATLKNYFLGSEYQIEEIAFASGVTWTPDVITSAFTQVPEGSDLTLSSSDGATVTGDENNNVVFGGDGSDYLWTYGGSDILIGAGGDDELFGGDRRDANPGNDTYIGGTGNDSLIDGDLDTGDTYLFNLGDGQDTLQDSGGGLDVLRFGAFITPADVYVSQNRDSGDLIAGIRGTRDTVTVEDFFKADRFTGEFSNQIERIEFDDGNAWDLQQLLDRIEATPGTAFDDDIHGTDAGETIDALGGNDSIQSYGGDDTVSAGDGSDFLNGGEGNDLLYGGAGNDQFIGDTGDDTLYGGAGDDIFWGEGDGDDTVSGGPGDDSVLNWVGDDTYLYDLGDEGQDIQDFSGYDRLVFGTGIGVSDLVFSGDTSNPFNSLSITLTGNPGTITLDRWGGEGRIEEFVFADGTHLTADQINALAAGEVVDLDAKPPVVNQPLADRAIKIDTPFALTLPAGVFSDPNVGGSLTLTATLPEQQWSPGQQSLPAWLSFDPLTRTFTGTPGSADGGTLTVEVRATDSIGLSVKDRFTLTVGDSADQNLVSGTAGDDALAGTTGSDLIEAGDGQDQLTGLAGDDTLLGGAGNDQLLGNDGDDVLIGGSGQDALDGGAGNDTLITGAGGSSVFAGDGDDTIIIHGSDLVDTGAGNNTLWFASNPSGASTVTAGSGSNHYIFSSNFGRVTVGGGGAGGGGTEARPVATFSGYDSNSKFSFGLGSLVIRADDGSELRLTEFDPDDVYGFNTIRSFHFNDGVELSYAEFISQGFDIEGGSGNDILSGTNITDRIGGLDGDDSLSAGAGDDTLTGGPGSDTLRGGAGNDVYVFNAGDGIDRLIDSGGPGGDNRIRFGAGIVLADLKATPNGNSITIDVGAGGDALHLEAVDPAGGDPGQTVTLLEFDDGSSITLAELIPEHEPVEEIVGTARSDVMIGTAGDDRISAGSGNDIVIARLGDDLVSGGEGRDLLFGGGGDDRFVVTGSDRSSDFFYGGPGTDSIIGGPADDSIRLHRFNGNNSIEAIDGGAGVNRIAGTQAHDSIDLSATAISNVASIDVGAGNDRVTGTDGSDHIIGGRGADVLRGGAGSDVYLFQRGDGRDRIIDVDAMVNSDRLQLGEAVHHDQLWFSRLGDDLAIDVIGTGDSIAIDRWYAGGDHQIETLQAGDNHMLSNLQVDQLVQAMAGFAPPAAGELDLSAQLRGELEPVLAASWEAA